MMRGTQEEGCSIALPRGDPEIPSRHILEDTTGKTFEDESNRHMAPVDDALGDRGRDRK
jgi:hypothetical protein